MQYNGINMKIDIILIFEFMLLLQKNTIHHIATKNQRNPKSILFKKMLKIVILKMSQNHFLQPSQNQVTKTRFELTTCIFYNQA